MLDKQAIKNEITNDPANLGFAGKTDAQVAALVNAPGRQVQRGLIPSYEVINATVPAEWAALTAQEKQRYQTITGAGQVDVTNANTRNTFAAMFAAGPTRTALAALQFRSGARWEELGWERPLDFADIAAARAS